MTWITDPKLVDRSNQSIACCRITPGTRIPSQRNGLISTFRQCEVDQFIFDARITLIQNLRYVTRLKHMTFSLENALNGCLQENSNFLSKKWKALEKCLTSNYISACTVNIEI